MTAYLNATQRAGLAKLGDVIIPGDADLPSFTGAGCLDHAEDFLATLTPSDRQGLTALLGVMRFLPRFAIAWLLTLIERWADVEGGFGGGARMALIGIKGVVMTLYYADLGNGVHARIGWDAQCGEPLSPRSSVLSPVPSRPSAADGHPYDGVPLPLIAPPVERPLQETIFRARAAVESLRSLSVGQRVAFLRRLRRLVLRRREEIVDRIQRDTAKSRSDALISEVYGVLETLKWLEKHAAKHLAPHKVDTPTALMGKQSWIWYEPLGVVLVIAPWNYPFYQAMVPIAFAVAAGNAVVHKPSEWTPLTGLVEDLLAEAQFGPNWVQVVYGDGQIGASLVEQRPDRIFFTGSTRTGRKLLAQAAQHLIPVELELGGKKTR